MITIKTINRSELSKTFNIALGTVDRWISRGCPHEKKGKALQFDLQAVKKWREKYQRSLQKEDPDYQAAKLKHKQEQARIRKNSILKILVFLIVAANKVVAASIAGCRLAMLEIANLVKLKKLCNAEQVQKSIERDYLELKKRLYNTIYRLPPLLADRKEPDIFETLKRELDEILTEFAYGQ